MITLRQQMADFARAERLRNLRDARHLSQEDAAHEIGVSVKSLRAWEKGGGIRWTNAKSVALFYGVEPETLVSRERDVDDPTPDLLATFSDAPEVRAQLDRIEEMLVEVRTDLAEIGVELASRRAPGQPRRRAKPASGT